MACQQSLVRKLEPAWVGKSLPPCGEPERSSAVEDLLRDIAMALHATRAIRRAMETGQVQPLANY